MLATRKSVLLWPMLSSLGLALAAPAADATVRTAPYRWAAASGPVAGYYLFLSVDGGPEQNYGAVTTPDTVIQLESGAEVVVRVAAYDVTGRMGPHSDASSPLRLCPGDFDGDEWIEQSDLDTAKSCVLQPAQGKCAGGDMNEDGTVTFSDVLAIKVGEDACPPILGCAGDMNSDGVISVGDFAALRSCLGFYAEGSCANGDFDGNGYVSVSDWVTASDAGFRTCD
jgi:hypothetical protein